MSSAAGVSDSSREYQARSASHRDLFVALIALLIWIPIPIGSNRLWSASILEFGALSICGIWALRYAYRPFVIPQSVRGSRTSLIILLAWLCYGFAQMLPIPSWLGQLVAMRSHGLYSDIPGRSEFEFLYFSLDRGATLSGVLRQCAFVAVFFGVLSLAGRRKRLYTLLIALFAVGFAQALYGLILSFGGDEFGLWNPGHPEATVSGTYVNQNHFAGLLEMTIPAGMGLLLMNRAPSDTGLDFKAVLRSVSATVLGQNGILLFGLVVMFAALILTESRGALGSLSAAIVFAVLLAVFKKGSAARELRIALVASALIVLAVLWLGAGGLKSRLESTGLASNRGDLRELSYQIIADSPVIGTGIGTYRWVLPRYKDERFGSGFYEHAHNDYLEILGEQGVVGFALLFAALGLVFKRVIRAYRGHKDPIVRGALFTTVVGCTSLLLHGFVDFNLQIPANATYFFALLGIGAVATEIGRAPNT